MDVFTLHALRRGKNDKHRIIEAGSVISLSGDELKRVIDTVAGREATKQEVAAAKAGHTYFDGSETTVAAKSAGAAATTSTASSTTTPATPEPTAKPFDKMTKAELDKALADGGFTAPENWGTLKNFDKATFLTEETAKAAEAAKQNGGGTNGDAGNAGNGNGNGGTDGELEV